MSGSRRSDAASPGIGGRAIGRLAAAGLVLAASVAAAGAQEARVRAMVDRTRLGDKEEVVLSVEIAAASFDQVAPPDLSRLDEFDIVGGPNVSSRFQWINGRTSSTRTYSYVLRPRRTGGLKIPALGVLVQGRTYHTESIDITVVPGVTGGQPAPAAPPPQAGAAPTPSSRAGPDVSVRTEVDTRTAFIGQQVTVRVLLDTQTDILNLSMRDQPTFPGFWAEEIKVPDNGDPRRVERNGRLYVEYTLMKKALFPTTAGTLIVPAMTYQIQVRRRSTDPIESFFFTPTETLTRRSAPVSINVQPLPAADRPPGFSGAVGRFNLSVSADRKEARVNDAVGLKVKIAGEGNLNAVNVVGLTPPADFKQYAPRVTSSTAIQDERLRAEKTWDYVLIPLAAGAQVIPPVTFSFFDPAAREYRSIASPPVPIQVARGEGPPGAPLPAIAQSDVRALRQDIHYIKQASGALRDRSRLFVRSPWFIALVVLPIAIDAGIVVAVRRRDMHPDRARQRRSRRAYGATRRRLREARRRMSPVSSRAFYAAVASALTEYLAAKFDTAAAGLTHDRIEELLGERGVPTQERSAFHRCLEACDFARFAPSSSGPAEMQRTLAEAENVVARLERSLSA